MSASEMGSKIILASASPRRRELLERIGLTDFIVRVPDVEESFPEGLTPEETVKFISREKADAAAALCGADDIVITADTMVFLDRRRLGKPRDEQDALDMLTALQGRKHVVCTGVTVRRGGEVRQVRMSPVRTLDGSYKLGAWVRDDTQGIGTLTYLDANGNFGALGHGITDVDTAQLMPFANGSILPSTVKAVKKGESGAAGELRGDFDLTHDLGPLSANPSSGVFGKLDAPPTASEALPVGTALPGPAMIRANVRGDEVGEYAIEILRVNSGASDGRDLVLSVTDSELLEITGGIVQGMSGSPILQDGQIVGAVTHV